MQTLVCSSCQKSWTRNPQRGRKPTLCKDCKSGITIVRGDKDIEDSQEDYVDMLIRKYGYRPEKITKWCQIDNHKFCKTVYTPDYKHRCRCKCHV